MKKLSILSSLAFILMACLISACGGKAGFDPSMAQLLQKSLDDSVAELAIAGAAVAVRAPDGTTWSGASGLAQHPGVIMTTDMHFHIASATKSFTSTIILQLVDEAKLGLDQTLDEIMARWFTPGYIDFTIPYSDTITLRNVLEMRSGMVDYLSTQDGAAMFMEHPLERVDPKEMLRVGAESTDPAPYPPDTRMEYCNNNFILQGVIIEQVTGNSYAAEAKARLFDPLGLTATSVPDDVAMPEPYAHGYLPIDGVVRDLTESFNPSYGWAAGAIISTVHDLVAWVTAINDGTLLSAAAQQERMKMREGVIETWPVSYGLGIYDDSGAVGHYGNYNRFYTAYPMRYKGYDFAVLTNGLLVDNTEPGWHAAREIFWNAARAIGIAE